MVYATSTKNGQVGTCQEVRPGAFGCAFCSIVISFQSTGTVPCPCGAVFSFQKSMAVCQACGTITQNSSGLCSKACELRVMQIKAQAARQPNRCGNCGVRILSFGPSQVFCTACIQLGAVFGGKPNVTSRVNPGSIRIWWEPAIKAYRMTTPWNKMLVDLLKSQIPASDRSWDPSSKIWVFTEKWLDPIVALCKQAFGFNPTIVTKTEAEKASVPPATQAMKLPSLHEKFFDLVPYNAMRKAYLLATMELHPDKGGDATKMAELNAIWQKLEKDFYKVGP